MIQEPFHAHIMEGPTATGTVAAGSFCAKSGPEESKIFPLTHVTYSLFCYVAISKKSFNWQQIPSQKLDITVAQIMRFLGAILFLAATIPSELAAPGASVPWMTYEAEDMKTTGTVMGPGYDLNTVEGQSSGRKCVKLTALGQYVEFTAKSSANALVVRYCVPHSADGEGIDSTISYFLNGRLVKKLPVSSKYSRAHGPYPFLQRPQYSPRNFYDEVRFLGPQINPGDTIRIQKDVADTEEYAIIDLIDLEMVPPALSEPMGRWLSVKDAPYNAAGNGESDDTEALAKCVHDAQLQGKNVWVPEGTYLISGDIKNLHDITIQGAGMWYTTFVGNPEVYNTNPYERVRFTGAGNNIHLADFAIIGRLNHRINSEPNEGLTGSYGTGSTISRIWVEHTSTGCWITNSKGLVIDRCRIRNTLADGINLCVGMRGTTVMNCATRGTGDDCFAIWPAVYTTQAYVPGLNMFTHCTGQLPVMANGGAIYGGESNRIEDCLFQDISDGCGLLISGRFPVGPNIFTGTTIVQRCDLIRCGVNESGRLLSALQFDVTNHPISHVTISNLNIIDSIASGISIDFEQKLSQVTISDLYLPDYGIATPGSHGLWAHKETQGDLRLSNSRLAEYQDDSPNFTFAFNSVTFTHNSARKN